MLSKRFSLTRRVKAVLLMACLLSASVFGLSLAAYAKEVGLFNAGWVGPKYYAFEVDYEPQEHKLAPGESTDYLFTVKNHNAGGEAQVPLKVAIAVTYPTNLGGTGYIQAELKQGETSLGSSDNGTLSCSGRELAANERDSDQYTLTLTWQDADTEFLGSRKSEVFEPSQIKILVSGFQ